MPMPSPSTVLLRTQSDERLVVLARAGHERAFEAIVERYRGALLRAARRHLPDARAEDALQHALLAAWNALQRGDDVRDLRAWLYRIVRNSALNQLRVSGYDHAKLEDSLHASDAPADEHERRAVVRRTLTELAALPERQREALLRIAVEGRSQDEVARQLGVSEGAVRQLVHRARLTLRAAATAVMPLPAATWLAGAGGGTAEAVGSAGAAALLAKAGAVVLATGAVAAPVIVVAEPSREPAAVRRATPSRSPAPSPRTSPPAAVATVASGRGRSVSARAVMVGPRRSGRPARGGPGHGSSRTGRESHGAGSPGPGTDDRGSEQRASVGPAGGPAESGESRSSGSSRSGDSGRSGSHDPGSPRTDDSGSSRSGDARRPPETAGSDDSASHESRPPDASRSGDSEPSTLPAAPAATASPSSIPGEGSSSGGKGTSGSGSGVPGSRTDDSHGD